MKSAFRAPYLDSSALVKLVVLEPGSDAVRAHLFGRRQAVTSALAHTEVIRAARESGKERHARQILARCRLLKIGHKVLEEAATMLPLGLRLLDAIHLASARSLRDELSHVVTYDKRMAEAAEGMGLKVRAPA